MKLDLKRLAANQSFRWSLVFIWMAVIFSFSNQAHSGEITEKYLGGWNVMVRKSAHMTEYGVLFSLVRWALAGSKTRSYQVVAAWSILICAFYSCSDEWHQTFVPGRSGQLADVLVDMGGVLIASIVTYYLCGLRSFWSRTRS